MSARLVLCRAISKATTGKTRHRRIPFVPEPAMKYYYLIKMHNMSIDNFTDYNIFFKSNNIEQLPSADWNYPYKGDET